MNQEPHNETLENESVKLLQDFQFLESKLLVYVLSFDGWSWGLAWAQLGVGKVSCLALTDQSRQQLDFMRENVRTLSSVLHPVPGQTFPRMPLGSVLTVHLTSEHQRLHGPMWSSTIAWLQKVVSADSVVLLISLGPGRELLDSLRKALGSKVRWECLRHRRLGGLTTARSFVGWSGPRSGQYDIHPERRSNPLRPLDRFLEPSMRLTIWKRFDETAKAWCPSGAGAKPFPWPFSRNDPWVVAPSSLIKREENGTTARVVRPMSTKEIGQLLDLREDWSAPLAVRIMEWDGGRALPLRFLVELVLEMVDYLRAELLRREGKQIETSRNNLTDWGRTRAPWLGDATDTTEIERMVYFGWVWGSHQAEEIVVATKADSAGADLGLWAVGGTGEGMEKHREALRVFLLRYWRRKLSREGRLWLASAAALPELAENTEAMRDCITRCVNASWWDWDDGSALLFWRWPSVWRAEARDGARGFHTGVPERRLTFPSPPITESWIIAKDLEKLDKLLRRRYITCGPCHTTVPRFPVPKGSDDIRVVWDLRKNGLNATMYTPSFFLATAATFLRRLSTGSFCGDFDIGEQFHNYKLHPSERPYCGVEIPEALRNSFASEGMVLAPVMRWDRLVFGWQSSPYLALRMLARALELVLRDPDDDTSSFRWQVVELNLPGSPTYNPGKPRVTKLRRDGTLAAELVIYFDDGRVIGPTEEICQAALRQATAGLQFMGNQDAARKRRPVTQTAGAWAGCIAHTDKGLARKFISQKKWERAKDFLDWLAECLTSSAEIERARFRSGKGFLLHVSQTYDFMQPHLKGFHLAEDAWRANRDTEGWKFKPPPIKKVSSLEEDGIDPDSDEWRPQEVDDSTPAAVHKLPRLEQDVRALRLFFDPPTPLQVIVRPVEGACYVAYGAGDASGEGFGSSIHPLGLPPLLRHGFWCTEQSEESSNWREFRNLLDAVRIESAAGRLVGRELWLATDNSTAASAYYKGTSSSRGLQDMVTELRALTLSGNFVLNIFHIAGTRMIEIGVDGLSRGEMQLGALLSTPDSAAPLHLSPLERSPDLRTWLIGWAGDDFKVARPKDWFYAAQQAGSEKHDELTREIWLWDLPPGAALHALEELGSARLKRHDLLQGIVIIPNLLQHEWRRRFTRLMDVYFVIPAGAIPAWPSHMHEALTVGLYLPLFRTAPWDWKRVPFLVPMGITLSRLFKEGDPSSGDTLRKFWGASRIAPRLPIGVTDADGENLIAPGEENDFRRARKGDHLLCPFECDGCCFFRIRGSVPNATSHVDTHLLTYIRRANLDAFWSRRPGTIAGNVSLFKRHIGYAAEFGIQVFQPHGPFPCDYEAGVTAAIMVLRHGQEPGRHEPKVKYASARKSRTLHTNIYGASAQGVAGALVWRSDRTRFVATDAPTDSKWFTCFMAGFKSRVGQRTKRDAALSIEIMISTQAILESEWIDAQEAGDETAQRAIAEDATFFLYLFCGSLRGFEGTKVLLTELRDQIVAPGTVLARRYPPHVGLPLSGRFKARTQEQQTIMIPIAFETASGLKPGEWTLRLLRCLRRAHVETGWVFQNADGTQRRMNSFVERFYDLLLQVQVQTPDLFPGTIDVLEDYHLGRSHRRGATTRATAAGVAQSDIDWINRWNIGMDESASVPMRVLYSDRAQLIKTYLRFSAAL